MSPRWIREPSKVTLYFPSQVVVIPQIEGWRGSPWDGSFEMLETPATTIFFTMDGVLAVIIERLPKQPSEP